MRLLRSLALTVVGIGAACSANEPPVPRTYQLASIAAAPLPHVSNPHPDDSTWVEGGTIALYADRRWEGTWNVRRKLFGAVTFETLEYQGSYMSIPTTPDVADHYLVIEFTDHNPSQQRPCSITETQLTLPFGIWSVDEVYARTP